MKKVLVLGMGKSGVAAAKTLSKEDVIITDIKCDDKTIIENLEELGINVVITDDQEDLVTKDLDLIVKNPGISYESDPVKKANKLGIPVINEMELAYTMLPKNVKIVGITGSNGKTTTSYLTYEMFKMAGLPVHLGGNMGIPLCSILKDIKEGDILVLEISSHQLVDLHKFKTNVSVLTNLSEVHLDMFHTFDNYMQDKKKIFNNHTSEDIAILNGKDQNVVNLTKDIPSKKLYFNSEKKADCYIKNDEIYYEDERVCSIQDIRLKGMHNYENVMCAIMASKQFNISNDDIKKALDNFSGVEHRIEFVRRLNEREFYNDSKATNNKSTMVALSSFNNPVILLLGGLDRGQSFDELEPYMKHVKGVITYGQTKNKIKDFCDRIHKRVSVVDNLEEATILAYNLSDRGDTILLSPACASWDQFNTFEERGNEFKKLVNDLK